MMIIQKVCSKCNIKLNISDFHRWVSYDKNRKYTGYRTLCKKCYNKSRLGYHRKYYNKNKDKRRETSRLFILNHPDKVVEYREKYKKRNQEMKIIVFGHYTNNNIHCQCPDGCSESYLEFINTLILLI